MEIEYLNENNIEEWDNFALKSDYAWFRHTTDWFKYSASCRFDSDSKNHSFFVKQNREIIAIVPLISEYSYPDRENQCFSMYSDYTPLPAIKNDLKINIPNLMDTIWEQILNIAKENNIKFGKFQIDPLIKYNYFKDFRTFNLLSKNAEIEFTSVNVTDLRNDEDTILRLMRKGHKAAIKQVLKDKNHRVDIFNKNNITEDKLLKFKEIHKKDAGRQTRTDKGGGNAFLALLWLNEINDYVAGALIMTYKNAAYYASYATLDSDILNGHHGYRIQWEVIKYLKSMGIELYETGINHLMNNNLIDVAAQRKKCEISKYQRGFTSLEFPFIRFKVLFN